MGGKKKTKKSAKTPAAIAKEAHAIEDREMVAKRLQSRMDALDLAAAEEAEADEEEEGEELEMTEGEEIPEGVDIVYMVVKAVQLVGGGGSWVIGAYDSAEEAEVAVSKANRELERLLPAMLVIKGSRNKVVNTGTGFQPAIAQHCGVMAIKHEVIPQVVGDAKIEVAR